MLDKSAQYKMLYFPLKMAKLAQQAYWKLLDIDCNFSRLICELLPSILEQGGKIYCKGRNYRHYNWKVVATEKRSKHGKTKKS